MFVSVTRTRVGARPNGFIIKDFHVEKNDKNWTISLLPANCGSPVPLLAVVDAIRGNNSGRNSAVFTAKGLTSNATVTRIQKASPRVRGTFNITYKEKVVKGRWH